MRSFIDVEYDSRKKKTKMEIFLTAMDNLVPWKYWVRMITPLCTAGKGVCPPEDVEDLLRMFLLRHWYNLSDGELLEALYEYIPMRRFMHRMDFLDDEFPDETTLRRFRLLLEKHSIDKQILEDLGDRLGEVGLDISRGRFVEARLEEMPGAGGKGGRK